MHLVVREASWLGCATKLVAEGPVLVLGRLVHGEEPALAVGVLASPVRGSPVGGHIGLWVVSPISDERPAVLRH